MENTATPTVGTAVYVTADTDYDHRLDDEVEVHHVAIGDDDGETIGTVYTVRRGLDAAIILAERIAADRRLELIIEAA